MRMQTGPDGIALIKYFENIELNAYPDPASGGVPWTIGYGCTGPSILQGCVISADEAEQMLVTRLEKEFEPGVNGMLDKDVTQRQFDALIDFAFNDGLRNLRSSTLLRKVNAGLWNEAADQFPKWNMAKGRVMLGLTRRRAADRAVFQGHPADYAITLAEVIT